MIRIDRNSVKPPPSLAVKGKVEKARAIKHFESKKKKNKKCKFKFEVYKAEDVRKVLGDLFLGKCAYCESRYASVHPIDVEHWRPKAEVENDGRPNSVGYYWMASEWENLLSSCIDCNRQRKQMINGTVKLSGKGNQFPIADVSKRAKRPGEEAHEQPLLLNPCDVADDPDKHLKFSEDGIVSAKLINGTISTKGTASIDVYGLNRSELVLDRLEVITQLKVRIVRINKLGVFLQKPLTTDVMGAVKDMIVEEMQELSRYMDRRRKYALMVQQLVPKMLKDAGITT